MVTKTTSRQSVKTASKKKKAARAPAPARKPAVTALAPMPPEHPPRRGMVVIHGAGSFLDDYYKPFVTAIEQRIGVFDFVAAYYADITNPPHATSLVAPVESPKAAKFRQKFQRQMEDQFVKNQPSGQSFTLALPSNEITIAAKEVTLYLFDRDTRAKIQQRLIDALDQAALKFDEIVFVSHSLGTLVAFDVLQKVAGRYPITTWFTLGCPLAKLRTANIRSDNIGQIKDKIAHWFNLYDTNDIVANAIGPSFPKPGLRIHDIFVDVAQDPVAAHDYMNNPETQDIIANALR